jgi:hypothetical protein
MSVALYGADATAVEIRAHLRGVFSSGDRGREVLDGRAPKVPSCRVGEREGEGRALPVTEGIDQMLGINLPRVLLQGPLHSLAMAVLPLLFLSWSCGREAPDMAPIQAATDAEQAQVGGGPAALLVESFDGLGFGFSGPHGPSSGRNPSDNSLAVGPNHIVQTVNSRLAVFTRRGERFGTTGAVLYGAVPTNTVFHGFGGACEERNNGDAVVRYDQLAERWLLVLPIFRRGEARPDQPELWVGADSVYLSPPGVSGQPGPPAPLFVPAPWVPQESARPVGAEPGRSGEGIGGRPPESEGVYSMCYAVSATPDPMGGWYRYEFLRPLFPDYPRPAIWPDGYYVPTSTGDDVIQKHACVVERDRMLVGEAAREQCFVLDGVNFLNNADLDGTTLPPPGAPNIMMATGGRQLDSVFTDDGVFVWQFRVDWEEPGRSGLAGPDKIPVAPYTYLCDGQLTSCVPQPGTDRRLDSQGDKIMSRLVYRRWGGRESMVAVHSVATAGGGGGVRWYEFRINSDRTVRLRQQGTFLSDGLFRWMASPAVDRFGNIGMGFSFGGGPNFPGQRFVGRLERDPLGQMTLQETVLVDGDASQTGTLRWEDYTTTAMDPRDDCTVWYVGDYLNAGAEEYSTRIGAFRMSGCGSAGVC